MLDGLTSLAEKSLVRAQDDSHGDARFLMLEHDPRVRGRAAVRGGPKRPTSGRRHAEFFELAERVAPQLASPDQRRWLGRLERDHDNIRAVLDRSTAAGDGPTAIRLGFAMWRYWQKRGHLAEARRRLDAIAVAPWSRTDPVLRARLMEAVGGVGWWTADLALMRPAYEEALEIWRSVGDRKEIANALYNASFRYAVSENLAEADPDGAGLAQMLDALEIYREIGDDLGYANVLWGIGNYRYFRQGADPEHGHGQREFAASLEIFRRVGDRTMEAWALHMLGSALIRTGALDESDQNLQAALRLFHDSGDVSGLALVLDDLASVSVARRDLVRAARLWGAARALSSASGVGLADFVDSQYEFYVRPSARVALDPAELERYSEEGRAMTLDESVAYALGVEIDALAPHDHTGAV